LTDYFELIAKRLSGDATPRDNATLQSWIQASAENELLYRRIEESWNQAKYVPYIKGQQRTFEHIARKLKIEYGEKASQRESSKGIIWTSLLRYAAAFVVFAALAGAAYYVVKQMALESQTVESSSALVVKSNPRGRKSLITLPDGTRVKLNSESSIEYRGDFVQNRRLSLVGEAFFDVVRDTLHPFEVNTGNVNVRVLGTSFNIRAYPFEETMSVAVASGKVRVKKKDASDRIQEGELTAMEMVELDHNNGLFSEKPFDPDEVLAWKDGVLQFKSASFGEIVGVLERWYGVDFVIERHEPITEGFTGRYNNPSLEVVLEGMSFSSDFDFLIEGEQVIIK
jgi:ferric-dicitrate binding protein FerR (iron transport regulator)